MSYDVLVKKSVFILQGEHHIFRDLYRSFSNESYSRCDSKLLEVKIKEVFQKYFGFNIPYNFYNRFHSKRRLFHYWDTLSVRKHEYQPNVNLSLSLHALMRKYGSVYHEGLSNTCTIHSPMQVWKKQKTSERRCCFPACST